MVWHSLHRLMWKTHRRPLAWSWLGSCAWAENFRESVRKEKWSGQQMKKSEHRLREPLEECCVPRSYYHCTFLGYHIVKDKSLLTICVCAFLQHIFKNILIVICITLWRNNCELGIQNVLESMVKKGTVEKKIKKYVWSHFEKQLCEWLWKFKKLIKNMYQDCRKRKYLNYTPSQILLSWLLPAPVISVSQSTHIYCAPRFSTIWNEQLWLTEWRQKNIENDLADYFNNEKSYTISIPFLILVWWTGCFIECS